MKIKKNGKVINLTESDLKRIVKIVLNEQVEFTDPDYDVAVKFAKSVEDWWEGSDSMWNSNKNSDFIKFFTPYQGKTAFGMGDADIPAAKAYEKKIMFQLNKEVGGGNDYYNDIKDWLDEIIDEMDDPLFQKPQYLPLVSTDGRDSTYMVDPEIDV